MMLALLFEAAEVRPQSTTILEEVLARARAAHVAAEPRLAIGTARALGLDASYELLFDPGRGAFAERRGGELSEQTLWDGAAAWSEDASDAWIPLHLRDLEETLLHHWVAFGYWSRPQSGLEIALLSADDTEAVLRLQRTGARTEGVLRVVRATGLPSVLELESNGQVNQWFFSNWDQGLARTQSFQGEDEELMRIELHSVAAAPAYVRNPYQALPAYPANARWDPEVPAAIAAHKAASGHLLVHPLVDGRDLGWFILDSGAGALAIDRADAEALGSTSFGRVPAIGVGGTVSASFHRAKTLQLGPLTLEQPLFVDLDLSFLDSVFGVNVGGIVGFDLLARAVVEVDLVQATVALHDPRRYALPRGTWQELLLEQRIPALRGHVEGHEAWLRLDTGADESITVLGPAVERWRLLEDRETTTSMLGGVGGLQPAQRGTLRELSIGGQRLVDLPASFAQSSTGAFADSSFDGNVGVGVLGRFVLVFDYFHQRLAFLPRE